MSELINKGDIFINDNYETLNNLQLSSILL